MTPTITGPIQGKLTEDEFNDGYKMYKRLKELLSQPPSRGEMQLMRLYREYYTLNYRNHKDMYDFLDHVKSLEEQIDVTNVEMTSDKPALLCLTMALWNEPRYQSLLQIWGVMTEVMTAEKAREMLLEDEQRGRGKKQYSRVEHQL